MKEAASKFTATLGGVFRARRDPNPEDKPELPLSGVKDVTFLMSSEDLRVLLSDAYFAAISDDRPRPEDLDVWVNELWNEAPFLWKVGVVFFALNRSFGEKMSFATLSLGFCSQMYILILVQRLGDIRCAA